MDEMEKGMKEWKKKYERERMKSKRGEKNAMKNMREKGINCIQYEFRDEKNSVKIKFIERRESMTKEVN